MVILLRRAGYRRARLLLHAPGVQLRDQRGLTSSERIRNVSGSLRASPRAAGKRVIIVDDVVTTGATVSEAVRALEDAGAQVVCVVTVTRVERSHLKLSQNG
jgi:predicted amidophosphoribosyltransferase